MSESPPPPQKPVRPPRNDYLSIGGASNLKVNPTTSINLENVNVNSPNLNDSEHQLDNINENGRLSNVALSPSLSMRSFNSQYIDDYSISHLTPSRFNNDNDSQHSIYSKIDKNALNDNANIARNDHNYHFGALNNSNNHNGNYNDDHSTSYPVLTINNNEQDLFSIMENELDKLMNDNNGLTNDLKIKESMANYQININDLLSKVTDVEPQFDIETSANIVELAKLTKTVTTTTAPINAEDTNFLQKKKQFFVLSASGKPIYSLFGSDSIIINYMSIIQTLISSFADANGSIDDNLKHFKAGSTKFVVFNKSPIYLLSISSYEYESLYDLKNQLYILYNYLISIISRKQLVKFYSLKDNFDLRKILNNSDYLNLQKIITNKVLNPVFFLGGIESLYLSSSIKLKINSIISKYKASEILYGILTDSNGKVITIVRPKNHYLHTSDLQILFSIIFNKKGINSSSEASADKKIIINKKENEQDVEFSNEEELWFPICLPEFNSNGFLYSFVDYIDINNIEVASSQTKPQGSDNENDDSSIKIATSENNSRKQNANSKTNNKLVLILLSPDKNSFFKLRQCSKKIISQIILSSNSQILDKLVKAFEFNYKLNYLNFLNEFNKKHPASSITSTSLPTRSFTALDKQHQHKSSSLSQGKGQTHNNFFHFLFKSRRNSQVFAPSFNSINSASLGEISFQKLMFLYKELFNNLQQSNNFEKVSNLAAATSSSSGGGTFTTAAAATTNDVFPSNSNASSASRSANDPISGSGSAHNSGASASAPAQATNNLNANSNATGSSKSNLVYVKWTINEVKLIGVGYSNSNYEIYLILKNSFISVSKAQLVDNLKVIINWIFKNFNRLFIAGLTF